LAASQALPLPRPAAAVLLGGLALGAAPVARRVLLPLAAGLVLGWRDPGLHPAAPLPFDSERPVTAVIRRVDDWTETEGRWRCRARVESVRQINAHVDLIDWKGGRGFIGEAASLAAVVEALARARAGTGEPVGILSHHLVMDDRAWEFLELFWKRTRAMSGMRVRPAHELFASN
jgi:hypothetical protein